MIRQFTAYPGFSNEHYSPAIQCVLPGLQTLFAGYPVCTPRFFKHYSLAMIRQFTADFNSVCTPGFFKHYSPAIQCVHPGFSNTIRRLFSVYIRVFQTLFAGYSVCTSGFFKHYSPAIQCVHPGFSNTIRWLRFASLQPISIQCVDPGFSNTIRRL